MKNSEELIGRPGSYLKIGWRGLGYDLIPFEELVEAKVGKLTHIGYYKKDKREFEFSLEFRGDDRILTYSECNINDENGAELGRLTIHDWLTSSPKISWEPESGKKSSNSSAGESEWVIESTSLDRKVEEGIRKEVTFARKSRDLEMSEARKQKDDFTCQACAFRLAVDGFYIVDAHHKTGLRKKEMTTIEDLLTLCPTCHRVAHAGKGKSDTPRDLKEIKKIINRSKPS